MSLTFEYEKDSYGLTALYKVVDFDKGQLWSNAEHKCKTPILFQFSHDTMDGNSVNDIVMVSDDGHIVKTGLQQVCFDSGQLGCKVIVNIHFNLVVAV